MSIVNPSDSPDGQSSVCPKNAWLPWLILGGLILAWIVFNAFTTPDFGGTDAFIFRNPGCNCAAGHGLVSDSVPTNAAQIPPQLFAAYTPGAPLLFAPAVRFFGCSASTDTYYNLFLLAIFSALILFLYLSVEERPRWRLGAAILLGITLPVGLFLIDLDRPEVISLSFALSVLLLWQRSKRSVPRALLLGSAGVLFLIHPYLGIVQCLLILFLLAYLPSEIKKLKIACGGLAITVSTIIAAVLYLHHFDPTVIHRFLLHAMGKESGAGVVLHGTHNTAGNDNFLHNYVVIVKQKYLNKANFLTSIPLLALLSNLVMLFIFTLRLHSKRDWRILQIGCLFCILFLFPAAVFLPQRNYFAASDALLFAFTVLGGYDLSDTLKKNGSAHVYVDNCCSSFPTYSQHTCNRKD